MSSEREMLKHVDAALRALASDPDQMQSIKLGQLPEIARKAMPKDSVSDAVLDEALGILARIRVTLSQTAQKNDHLEVNRTGFLDLMRCRFHELIACTNEDLTLHTINAFSQRFEATWRLDNLRDVDAIIARTEDNLEEVESEVLAPLQVEETTLDSNECDLAGHWQGVSDEIELGDAFVVKKPLRAAAHQMWAESGPTHVAFAVRPASAMVSLLRRGAQPPRASAVSCIGLEAGAVSFFDSVSLALEHHKKTSVLTRASGLYLVCFDLALGPRERCVDVKSVPPSLPTGANAACMSVTSASGHEGKRWLVFNAGQARLHSFAKLM
ncbi:Hypothetical Protein FCC1311_032132 [Hondaea fermentalgiana]|uniref:Uncharacterized protein n=1 Tax=Hondaea fermentalgiana TaxID=2315210 RepID=A0A2R5G7L7_9STRA|nr:Hypothetical Protein FCC1311_032132 [Hondaea fermentalgiana]|eukprot:GBG26990.1 Hypothetical Protein FCC1311_032132 [Hondaea fermentalgiana]